MITVFYKPFLSEKEQKAYDSILEAIIHHRSEVTIEGIDADRVFEIVKCINRDRPELFFVEWNINMQYNSSMVKVLLEYCYGEYDAKSILGRIDSIAKSIVAAVKNKTQYDAALWLHDYLATNIEYTSYESKTNDAYTIVGALEKHKCVCEGYARAYKYLCDKAGIQCFFVGGEGTDKSGKTEGHAWNMVKIGNKSYHVDVTFDSHSDKGFCSRANFLLSTKQMLFDHIPEAEYALPYCAASLSPLPVVKTFAELKEHLRRDSKSRQPYTEYRFVSPVKLAYFDERMKNGFADDDPGALDYLDKMKSFICSDKDVISTVGIVWKI